MRAPADTRHSPLADPPLPPPTGTVAWVRHHLPSLVIVVVAGSLVAAFFLGLYWAKHYDMPIGWDTPRYLDQTNLVAAHGLAGVPDELPPPTKTLPSRGGFPIVVLTMSSLFGLSTFKLAAVVPPAAAMAVALAAGAVVTWTLRHGPWSLAATALLVGSSGVVIRLMAPETYSDNLFAAAMLTAALVPMLSAAGGKGGLLAAAILFGAASVAHSPSFAVVGLAIGLAAVALAPWSWRSWRSGDRHLLGTPSVRLSAGLLGGAAIGSVAIFGVLRATPDTPKLSRGELIKKVRADVPLYRYWLTVPLAALGAAHLWTAGGRRAAAARGPAEGTVGTRAGAAPANADRVREPRILLVVLLSWAAVAAAGVALFVMGRNAPAHRFLSFLIPLPILLAVGVLWLGRRVSSAAGDRPAFGRGLVVVAILGLGALGYHDLYSTLSGPTRGVEWLDKGKVQDAATAAAYLDAVRLPDGAPVVFVLDDQGPNPLSYVPEMTYMLRAVLPADRVPHAYVYVGNPDKYLAGEPTYRSHPKTYDANADRFWPTVQALLPSHPVALLLSSYNPMYRAEAARHPERIVAPGVIALVGPKPPGPVAAPPIPTGPRGPLQGVLIGAAALVLITLMGIGWAAALLPVGVRPFETFALAPGFGFATLILGGIVVDALGLRLTGVTGALTPIVVGAVGMACAILVHRRPGPSAGTA